MEYKECKVVEVLELADHMPSYGENEIKLRTEGLKLYVDIFFDAHEVDGIEYNGLSIVFEETLSFQSITIPGVDLIKCNSDRTGVSLSALVEYTESAACEAWKEQSPILAKELKHYNLFFMAANKSIDVFASAASLNC